MVFPTAGEDHLSRQVGIPKKATICVSSTRRLAVQVGLGDVTVVSLSCTTVSPPPVSQLPQINEEFHMAHLVLVGTVHRDAEGHDKLLSILHEEDPDCMTLEMSPYAVRFRREKRLTFALLLTQCGHNYTIAICLHRGPRRREEDRDESPFSRLEAAIRDHSPRGA